MTTPLPAPPPQPMPADQIEQVRRTVEQTGFLPMTKQALRLFAAAEFRHPGDPILAEYKRTFEGQRYLTRTDGLRLIELAGGGSGSGD
jgi:hypothetical protein